MTVLLPGMTEDDQRVKISSCDTTQQGLLDSWKTKVLLFKKKKNEYPFWVKVQVMCVPIRTFELMIIISILSIEYGQRCRTTQQNACME